MNTKTILSLAILAALPLTAMAENISGAMYAAPTTATQNNPAPTTNANAPYGRIDIDTADKDHIASTAYVKGAYNSAIAAVNKLDADKVGYTTFDDSMGQLYNNAITPMEQRIGTAEDLLSGLGDEINRVEFIARSIDSDLSNTISNKRVDIYTTWDADNSIQVELSEVRPAQGNN